MTGLLNQLPAALWSRRRVIFDAFLVGYGLLLPVPLHFVSTPLKGILGALLIIGTSLRWGLRGGITGFIWAGGTILVQWFLNPISHPEAIVSGLFVYLVLAVGVGRTVDSVRAHRDQLLAEIDLRKNIEADREVRRRQLLALFENSVFGIAQLDSDTRIVDVNRAFTETLGYEPGEALGQPVDRLLVPDSGREESSLHQSAMLKRGKTVSFHSRRRHRDGSLVPVEIRGIPIVIDGEVGGGYAIYIDVTAQKEYEERLRYLSFFDRLTGLHNRSYFEEELRRLENSRLYPITIVSMDADGLKLVNDTLGHQEGDRMLKAFAEILKTSFRKSDVVARIGGDEFAVILPETDTAAAVGLADRLREGLKEYSGEKSGVPLRACIGIATAVNPGDDLEEILIRADEEMYREKDRRHASDDPGLLGALLESLGDAEPEEMERLDQVKALIGHLAGAADLPRETIERTVLLAKAANLGTLDRVFASGDGQRAARSPASHVYVGSRIASASASLHRVSHLILHHHELWDGSGYPDGLEGEDIPIECRLYSLADAYVRLARQAEREGRETREVLKEIRVHRGTRYDPALVELLAGILSWEGGPSESLQPPT